MKRVVIIGGGFSATSVAKQLESKFDAVLVDTKDYFEYTPGILRTIVEPDHARKIQRMHKDYLKKSEIIVGRVLMVSDKYIVVKGRKRINYDYLIICSGSNYNLPIKEQDVLIGSRADHLEKAYWKLMKAEKVLIIGGGLVGVELAAEICTHWKGKGIVLIQSSDKLIPRNNLKTISYVEKFLRSKGVKLICGERMKSVKNGVCITESGKKIKSDMIFLTVGIVPNYKFMKKNFSKVLDSRGQIRVNDYLQVKGQKNIFAAGDVVSVSEEKTAQNAERQAAVVVRNIRALESGKGLVSYVSKRTLLVISLGRYDGVIEYGNFVLGGKLAALMKWLIEKAVMFGYR